MVRIIFLIFLCTGVVVAEEVNFDLLPRIPRREGLVLSNFAEAINAYYKRTGKLPTTLEDIRDDTDLTIEVGDIPGLKPFTERYALLPFPIELPTGTKMVMVSLDKYAENPFRNDDDVVRQYAVISDLDWQVGSGTMAEWVMIPLLEKAGVTLKPIGGIIPAPTKPRPTVPENAYIKSMKEYQAEYLARVARGEIPPPQRTDKEAWRDEKPPESPIPTPTPTTAPVAPPPAKSSNPLWWIFGAIVALVGVVLIVRRKKPKA